VRRLAAAATTVTVLALVAWLALARSGSDGAAAAAPVPAPAARAPAPSAGNPLGAARLPASGRFPVSGAVVERLPAGPYTYLRVRPAAGGDDLWLAMMAGSAPAGNRVDAVVMGQKANFHSRRLGRSFDLLLFASATAPAASSSPPIASPAKGPQP
jgi:hypothetical protein